VNFAVVFGDAGEVFFDEVGGCFNVVANVLRNING
jgi:hypothetical protein